MLGLIAQSCLTLCDTMDSSLPGSSVHRDSPGKNTGVGCHAFLQGIFLTQESNQGLLHCRWIPYQLSHHGSPQSQAMDTQTSRTSTSQSWELVRAQGGLGGGPGPRLCVAGVAEHMEAPSPRGLLGVADELAFSFPGL